MSSRINPGFVNDWPINKLSAAAKRLATETHKDGAKALQMAAYIIHDRLNVDRDRYIAGMCAAFLDKTGLDIEDVQLIVKELPNGRGVAMWFEKRSVENPKDKPNEITPHVPKE